MDIKRFWIIIIICSTCAANIVSQSYSQFNHYFRTMANYNPAYVGKTGDLNVHGLFRQQWVGFGSSPRSIFAAADMPWKYKKTQHGVGVVVVSEKVGLDTDMNISLQYAYKKKIGKGTLSAGLQIGLMSKSFQGDSLDFGSSSEHDPNDEVEKAQTDAKSPDFALGLFYSTDKYYIGFACTRILEPTLKLSENMERKISRGYNLTAGYNIQTGNPLIELQPSLFVQMSSVMVVGDITARAVYNKMFNGGLGMRLSDRGRFNAAILYLGATIKKFDIGYAYEFPTSAVNKDSSGSHEFMVTYRLNLNKKQGDRNRHKSIRIL